MSLHLARDSTSGVKDWAWLLLATGLLASWPGLGWAEDRVVLKTETYADTDKTTVVRPVVDASKEVAEGVELGASYAVDVISTASIDVVTSATSPSFRDRRQEVATRVGYQGDSGLSVGASFTYSYESDYLSRAVGLNASRDFLGRNTTLYARAGLKQDTVLSIVDPQFEQALWGWGYALGGAQVLSKELVVRAGYEGAFLSGYQQSPYRFVRFDDFRFRIERGAPIFEGVSAARPETHPARRLRHSLNVGAAWHLGENFALHPRYSAYLDSWGVVAHDLELQLFHQPWEELILRASYRRYLQSAADFYLRQYREAPESYSYFSADKRLGRVYGQVVGGRVEYAVPGPRGSDHFRRLGVDAKVDLIFNEYPDFIYLDNRQALVCQLGLFVEL